jgi:uncharacterized protein YndB with AHSA1/START domain
MVRSMVVLAAGTVALVGVAYEFGMKPWRRRWLAGPDAAERALPGDDVVADADFCQTMAITIDAPPSAVWPWLTQQGYGRAGWYSYDAMDMRGHSSREIRPELQHLVVGDSVPFAPGLGFRVEALEPGHALVLSADSEALAAPGGGSPEPAGEPTEREGAGLGLVGKLADANAGAFRMSWAFVLEPVATGRTLLLERFRTRATPGPATVLVRPIVDNGHFLMTRKHLLGIKERAERTPGAPGAAAGAA